MKDSKLYAIIAALKSSQINLLERNLKTDKRKSLFVLFQLLLKAGENSIEKEALFYKIFKKKYTAAGDYLLRNEMRLLIEKIELLLVREQLDKLLEKDKLFGLKQQLQLYKNLDLYEIYTEIWKQAKAIAIREYRYQEAIELNAEYFDFAQFHIRNYKDRLEIFDQLLDEHILFTNYFFAQQFSYLSFIEGNANKLRLEYQTTQQHKIPQETYTISLNEFHSTINNYYTLVGKWFPEQSKGKTYILLEALTELEKCEKDAAIFQQEHLRILYLIATDFSMSAEFKNANDYFEKLFRETPNAQLHNKAYYLYNYAVNLTKLDNYEKALTVIEDAEKHIKPSNEFLNDKYQLLKVICYMFTQNSKQLKKLLPTDFSVLLPEQRIYFRFVNAIYYIINHEYDLGAEEISNLLRSKLINETDPYFLVIAKFYKNALQEIAKGGGINISKNALQKIKAEAQQIDCNEASILVNYMPYKWLKTVLKL